MKYHVRNLFGEGFVDRAEAERVFTTWPREHMSGTLQHGFTVWDESELGGVLITTIYIPVKEGDT